MSEKCFWQGYTPATIVAMTYNQGIISGVMERTFRIFVKPLYTDANKWKIWIDNNIDSTPLGGPFGNVVANQQGGNWKIKSAYISDGGKDIRKNSNNGVNLKELQANGAGVRLKFNNTYEKSVLPGEQFWSDTAEITIPKGNFLEIKWTISAKEGQVVPCTFQNQYSCFYKDIENESQVSDDQYQLCEDYAVVPRLIVTERKVKSIIGFLGDSITQGFTTSRDSYSFWVAKVADKIGIDYGFWNLGSGWGRMEHAATDGTWLSKAKKCDIVFICLGVNDIINDFAHNDIFNYLLIIVRLLKINNKNMKIILCTVPPFNFTEYKKKQWLELNEAIKNIKNEDIYAVFDIASALSMNALNESFIRDEFNSGDGHPGELAGKFVSKSYNLPLDSM